ncbi:MAG TPA: rhomboid family intramembrane serine protease [Actinomycetales bacterium]
MDGVDPAGPSAPPTAEPVCPRHPDRVSYVRCQRCERPTCPACQRQAAVGFQCVDCVREQAASTPVVRTAFGGAVTSGRPVVTQVLVALCVGVYLLQLVPGLEITQRFAFAPVAAESQPYRFVTAAFLHQTGFLPHILFNMFILWQIGPVLEQQLGRVRFLALYVLAAVGGSVGYLALADPLVLESWRTAVVGASGAVFGLFGALMVLNRRLGMDNRGILTLIAINAVIGFVPGLNIAWQAHLGGLVTGALAAAVLIYAPRARRSVVQGTGLLGVLLVLVAISLFKLSTA